MRSRAFILGIAVTLMLTACVGETEETTTSTSLTTTTSVVVPSTTASTVESETTLPEVMDTSTWMCHYLTNFVAIQDPSLVTNAVDLLQNYDQQVGPAVAADALGESDQPPNLDQITAAIDAVLGFVDTASLDPLQAALFLENEGVQASPIHAVGLAGHWTFKPGTDPVPMDNAALPPVDPGTGPYLAVVDSGFVPEGPDWIGGDSVLYEDPFDREPEPFLASHGTFITGLMRQLAPSHRVSIARVPFVPPDLVASHGEEQPSVPVSSELHVFEAVVRLIDRHVESPEEVVALNMSLGTYSCNPDEEALLMTLAAALEMWDSVMTESEIFAAGGNEEYTAPFWPGAFSDVWPGTFGNVRAVGAAANQGSEQIVWKDNIEIRAPSRDWIDDVAPGSNLVGLAGEGSRSGTELVAWSGSSFASAVAAALYARGDTPQPFDGIPWWLGKVMDYGAITGLSYTDDPTTGVVVTAP